MSEVKCNCPWNPDSHADDCPVGMQNRIENLQFRLNAAKRRDTERIEEIEILQRQLDRFRNQAHGIPALAEHERLNAALAQRDAKLAGVVEALRNVKSTVRGMASAAGNQPSVATGYLRDIADDLDAALAAAVAAE